MKRITAATLACFAVLGLACTGAKNEAPILPPTGTGGSSGPGPGPSGTVTVWVDTPTPNSILGAGTLVDVTAHAIVENGTDVIDTSMVTMSVVNRGGAQPIETGQLVFDPMSADLFVGQISLGNLPSAEYTLIVSAKSTGGAMGSVSIDFVVEGDATLIVRSPLFGKHYKDSVVVEIIASDPAGLASVEATIADMPVTLDALADPAGTYRGIFNFNQPNPPLDGEQLLIVTVFNNTGRRSEVRIVFDIDNDGPIITKTTPRADQVVGNVILISATIQDGADVLDSSVIAVIGDETTPGMFELPLEPAGLGVYAVLFDTAKLTGCPDPPATGPCIVYPTISFRASDQLGNESAVTHQFAVDNIAPVADLDSADVRVLRKDGFCSRLFDPLALNRWIGDMPNDGAVVPQVFDLRARVEDHGNSPTGIKAVPISGIHPDRTDVYILDDTSIPLIVDMDGDGTCDAINPKLIPTTQPPVQNDQVLKVRLAGVPKQGQADFRPDGDPPPANICSYPATASPPEFLCDNGQPFTTISYARGQPTIWSVEPINGAWCMGSQFDTRANNIREGTTQDVPGGWACIAVQSSDFNGNTSVSAPLRVYIRYNGSGAGEPAPANLGSPPPCTGSYDRTSDTVTSGTCTSLRFDTVDYCFEGDC